MLLTSQATRGYSVSPDSRVCVHCIKAVFSSMLAVFKTVTKLFLYGLQRINYQTTPSLWALLRDRANVNTLTHTHQYACNNCMYTDTKGHFTTEYSNDMSSI